ncbi:Arc family DNA-binding protein [Acinetobacter radioresistens]
MSTSSENPTTQYNLRWPEDLKEKVIDASKENTRSINQEILARLESSFSLDEDCLEKLNTSVDAELIFIREGAPLLEENYEEETRHLQFPVGQLPNTGDMLRIKNQGAMEKIYLVTQRFFMIGVHDSVRCRLYLKLTKSLLDIKF